MHKNHYIGRNPRLLDQVRSALRERGCSLRTEKAYVRWIKRYIYFHEMKHPSQMGRPEIEKFLKHLENDCKFAPSTRNQALVALLFLYRRILRKNTRGMHRGFKALERNDEVVQRSKDVEIPCRQVGSIFQRLLCWMWRKCRCF